MNVYRASVVNCTLPDVSKDIEFKRLYHYYLESLNDVVTLLLHKATPAILFLFYSRYYHSHIKMVSFAINDIILFGKVI